MVLLKFLVLTISIFPLVYSIKNIIQLKINAAILYYPVFFIFFPLHILFDLTIGKPNYGNQFYNFSRSYDDNLTNLIYLFFLLFLILTFIYLQRKNKVFIQKLVLLPKKISFQ